MRYRSKTLATWLAVFAGALGAQRFYLHGPRDGWAWAHLPFTLVGLWGAWRMHALGMLAAIVIGLTPDARWDERYNAGLEPRTTGWLPVLGVIVALMLGGIALMGTIAFSGQRFFEWHQGQ
jgi:nitric oxide reductase large subunit